MTAVDLIHVHKTYSVRSDHQRRSLLHLGRERSERRRHVALHDVTASFPEGSTTAVVGDNGSGKSTLLRIIAGVTQPTSGEVRRRVAATGLLNLGGGLHGPLSGRENAVTLMMLAGLDRRRAEANLSAVAEYSHLGDAFDWPVRTYSSGMRMRLAFSALVHARPRLLLLDEILAVGDRWFRPQCLDTLAELRDSGDVTMVFTSHDIGAVRRLCQQAIWLDHGRVAGSGPASRVADEYEAEVARGVPVGQPVRPLAVGSPSGRSGRTAGDKGSAIRIGAVRVRGEDGSPPRFDGRSPVVFEIPVEVTGQPADAIFQLGLLDQSADEAFFRCNSEDWRADLHGRAVVTVRFRRLALPDGSYHVYVGAFDRGWRRLAMRWRQDTVEVTGSGATEFHHSHPYWNLGAGEPPETRVEQLFVVSERRTGSNLLMDLLTKHPGVTSAGELLHHGQYPELVGTDGPAEVVAHLVEAMRPVRGERLRIGKVQFEQMEDLGIGLEDVIGAFPVARFVVLMRRELLEQYVSNLQAHASQRWVRTSRDGELQQPRVSVEPEAFREFAETSRRRYGTAVQVLAEAGATYVVVDYDEVASDRSRLFSSVLCPWLELPFVEPEPTLLKQGAQTIEDALENPEVLSGLRGAPWARHDLPTTLGTSRAASR